MEQGKWRAVSARFGRRGANHLYFFFAHRHFLKQEQLVKCLNVHSNPTAAIVPKCMDSGSE
jgi:hypothetical protein